MMSGRELLAVSPLHVVHDVIAVLAAVQADRDEARLGRHEAGTLLHQLEHLGLVLGRNLDRGDLGDDVVAFADLGHGRSPRPRAGKTTPVPRYKFPADASAWARALAFDGIADVGILERERLLECRLRLDALPPVRNSGAPRH